MRAISPTLPNPEATEVTPGAESPTSPSPVAEGAAPASVAVVDDDRFPVECWERARGGAARILVVDDEAAVRRLARRFLESWGLVVEEAADGAEALARVAEVSPDLVLLDVDMPVADGFEVLESLRAQPTTAELPVVMITALDDPKAIDRAYELGATDFFTKPIHWPKLRYRTAFVLRAHRAFDELSRSRERLASAQRMALLGHWDAELGSPVVRCSPEMCRIFGLDPGGSFHSLEELVARIHPDDADEAREVLAGLSDGEQVGERDFRLRLAGGEERVIRSRAAVVRDEEGAPVAYTGTIQDVTEARRGEEQRRTLSQMVEQSKASVMISDPAGRLEYVNATFEEVTGYRREEVIGKDSRFLASGVEGREFYRKLWATITSGREWRGETQNKRKDGSTYWESRKIAPIFDRRGRILHFVSTGEDITVRKEYEQRLLHQANFDDLTGLPNRLLAFDRLGRALVQGRAADSDTEVLFLDVDGFRAINETLGYDAGDRLLVEIARRLEECAEDADTVARLGGDDFLVVRPQYSAGDRGKRVAEKILAALERPVVLDEEEIFVKVSIGRTVAPLDGEDPHLLMRNAEAAMYRAKRRTGCSFEFFTESMNELAAERMRDEARLRRALEQGELFLDFQPIVSTESGELRSVEALLRWRSEGRVVPPDRFIPLAEDTGLIVPIGSWVLRQACEQSMRWEREAGIAVPMAVNLSPRQVDGEDLAREVARVLEETGLPPERLELEITERLLVADDPSVHATLGALKAMGVRLSLDDFGTGRSSLAYVRRFDFDVLKIDRSFTGGMSEDEESRSLVAAIVAMGKSLGLEVVAEGVETAEQRALLVGLGCVLSQGFLFGRPVPPEGIVEFARRTAETRSGSLPASRS